MVVPAAAGVPVGDGVGEATEGDSLGWSVGSGVAVADGAPVPGAASDGAGSEGPALIAGGRGVPSAPADGEQATAVRATTAKRTVRMAGLRLTDRSSVWASMCRQRPPGRCPTDRGPVTIPSPGA